MTPDIDRLIALCEKAIELNCERGCGSFAEEDASSEAMSRFEAACDPQIILALCAENKRLTAALDLLRIAQKYVLSQNRAEHMLDGFGPKSVQASDADLEMIDRVLADAASPVAETVQPAISTSGLSAGGEAAALTAEVERLRGEGELCVLAKDLAAEASVMETLSKSANYSGDERKTYAWCARELRMMANQTQLRTGAHSTSAATEGAVTDAMVDAAIKAHSSSLIRRGETYPRHWQVAMRSALEAALAAAPGGERK